MRKHGPLTFVVAAMFSLLLSVDARAQDEDTPKVEVAVLFTSLIINQPRQVFGPPVINPFLDLGNNTELGLGGRLTFNINDNIALEAEGSFFPRESQPGQTFGGRLTQALFGAKVGRRWDRFGLFAKARPGVVTFSRVRQLVGMERITIPGPFDIGVFEDKRKSYFSADIGGVLELYPSRRIVTRLDFGDTIIRYDTRHLQSILLSLNVITIPPERRHNFQFTAGVGFRF